MRNRTIASLVMLALYALLTGCAVGGHVGPVGAGAGVGAETEH